MNIAAEKRIFEVLAELVKGQNDQRVSAAEDRAAILASTKLAEASVKVAEQAVAQNAEAAKETKAQIKEIHDLMVTQKVCDARHTVVDEIEKQVSSLQLSRAKLIGFMGGAAAAGGVVGSVIAKAFGG
ncbi:MAG: hypothetical protein IMZ62_13040 [Chloroflexi bacterium]|nr:hypothetical protein [Chloroflexota bacterium]